MIRWLPTVFLACYTCLAVASETEPVAWEQRLGAQLPLQSQLRDELGQPVTLGNYFDGVPVIVVFAYFSCPQLCPQVLAGVGETLRHAGLKVGSDVRIVVIGIDPKDTPTEALELRRHSALNFTGARTANVLTSDAGTIASLTSSAGFHFRYDAGHMQFAHAAGFLLADPRGVISRYFFGIRFPPDELRAAVQQARGGRIGALTDRILMTCFAFDPTHGRYSSLVLFSLRVLTLAGFGVLLALWFRSTRARSQA